MHIDFTFAVQQPKRLTPDEIRDQKKRLIEALYHDNVDEGLIQWVDTLVDGAEESGYHGGYSDAHYYLAREQDGA